MEPAPKIAKKEPPIASAPPPGTGGPQPPAEPPLRPSGYPKWYFFSPGTGERREFTIRCTEDLGRLSYDDFKFAKRVSGLLRGYDHKFLEPHHRHIPPEFDDQLYLNFESMYSYLKKRFRAQLSKPGFVSDPEDTRSVYVSNRGGRCRGTDNLGHAVSHHSREGLPRT